MDNSNYLGSTVSSALNKPQYIQNKKLPSKISESNKAKSSLSFKKILNSETRKVSQNSNIITNKEKIHNNYNGINEVGTEIALDKDIREQAIKMEQAYISMMWQIAGRVGKDGKDMGIGGQLYNDTFVDNMVKQSYEGYEGGPLAESIYENLKTRNGLK